MKYPLVFENITVYTQNKTFETLILSYTLYNYVKLPRIFTNNKYDTIIILIYMQVIIRLAIHKKNYKIMLFKRHTQNHIIINANEWKFIWTHAMQIYTCGACTLYINKCVYFC